MDRRPLRFADLTGSDHRAVVETWGSSLQAMAESGEQYPLAWAVAWLNLRRDDPTVSRETVEGLSQSDVEPYVSALAEEADPTSGGAGGE